MNWSYISSGAALLISIASAIVATGSAYFAYLQYKVSLDSLAPLFGVREVYAVDPETRVAHSVFLEVRNEGGPAKNISLHRMTLLVVEGRFQDLKILKDLYLDLTGFYFVTEKMYGEEGLIFKVSQPGNITSFMGLWREWNEKKEEYDDLDMSHLRVEHLLRLSFVELSGRDANAYFENDREISEEEYKSKIDQVRNGVVLDLDRLDADKLYEVVTQLSR